MALARPAVVLLFLLFFPALLLAQTAAEWQAAADRIVRLAPANFRDLPPVVRRELESRGCLIPQLGSAFGSDRSNVVSGQFARPGQRDWAVLCSRADSSQVLLFWGGRADRVADWAPTPDAAWLQSMGTLGIQYSQYLATADSAAIAMYAREHGGPLPPGPITHHGLEVGFAEKASAISYWNEGRWYALQGAD
jgi:hypothetical protein